MSFDSSSVTQLQEQPDAAGAERDGALSRALFDALQQVPNFTENPLLCNPAGASFRVRVFAYAAQHSRRNEAFCCSHTIGCAVCSAWSDFLSMWWCCLLCFTHQ